LKNIHKLIENAIKNVFLGVKNTSPGSILIDNYLFFRNSYYPCTVSVDTPLEYLQLLIAGLDAINLHNYKYSKKELNHLKIFDSELRKWYQLNVSYMYSHELGHFLCSQKFRTVQANFQVNFFLDNEGLLEFFPSVKLRGFIQLKDYLKIVLSPDEPSDEDWSIYHYYKRLLS
jgi:hypothetical protein